MKYSGHILFFLLLMKGLNVSGQQLSDTLHLDAVNVYGSVPLMQSVLNNKTIDPLLLKQNLTTNLSDLLTDNSSLYIKTSGRGASATASFRGTAASHTQVIWNGISLNSAMMGLTDLSLVPVYFIDKVGLLYGGSSLQNGTGGLGGSIILDNRPSWDNRFEISYRQLTGSYGTYNEYLEAGGGNAKFQLKTRIFHEKSANEFTYKNIGILPQRKDTLTNAGYSRTGFLQEVYAKLNNRNILSLQLWTQQNDRDLPQLMSYQGNDRIENQQDKSVRGSLTWKRYGKKSKLTVNTGLSFTQLGYYRSTDNNLVIADNTENREANLYSNATCIFHFNPFMYLQTGLSVNHYHVNALDKIHQTGYSHFRTESSFLTGFYTEINPKLKGYLLTRAEIYDSEIIPLIPSLGVEITLIPKKFLVLKSNISGNYHKPTLNDLYWMPGGNSSLLPEKGYTAEVNLLHNNHIGNENIAVQMTCYYGAIKNWILWQPSKDGANYWEAANVKNVLTKGMELNFSVSGEEGNLTYRLSGNYAYSLATNQNATSSVDNSRGKQLIYTPKNTGNLSGILQYEGFYIFPSLNYTGLRYTNSSNVMSDYENILNPYMLTNISIGKKLEMKKFGIDLKFRIENLLNVDYQAVLWRPMPGRNYSLTLQFII